MRPVNRDRSAVVEYSPFRVDVFGPMTLPEYDERIRGYAKALGVEVEDLVTEARAGVKEDKPSRRAKGPKGKS